jgi:hypothetical protein
MNSKISSNVGLIDPHPRARIFFEGVHTLEKFME